MGPGFIAAHVILFHHTHYECSEMKHARDVSMHYKEARLRLSTILIE